MTQQEVQAYINTYISANKHGGITAGILNSGMTAVLEQANEVTVKFITVSELPDASVAQERTIYLVPSEVSAETDAFDEYIVVTKDVNGVPTKVWEHFGVTQAELDTYATDTDLAAIAQEVEENKFVVASSLNDLNDRLTATTVNLNAVSAATMEVNSGLTMLSAATVEIEGVLGSVTASTSSMETALYSMSAVTANIEDTVSGLSQSIASCMEHTMTIDFQNESETVQTFVFNGIIISAIKTDNVSALRLSVNGTVQTIILTSGAWTGTINIPSNSTLIWDIDRVNNGEPAIVSSKYENNI